MNPKTCELLATGNIRSPKGRLSYTFLLETNPKAKTKDGKLKYTTSLLLPPDCDLTLLKNAAIECAKEEFGEKLIDKKTGLPLALKTPFLKGEEKVGPDFKGWTLLRLSAMTRPGIVDARGVSVTEPQDVYSGRWAFISMNPFAYDVDGNKGVSFGMANVQVLDHDDPLAGRPRPESEFVAVEGVATGSAGGVFDD